LRLGGQRTNASGQSGDCGPHQGPANLFRGCPALLTLYLRYNLVDHALAKALRAHIHNGLIARPRGSATHSVKGHAAHAACRT
jgi:hypothetical protein